MVTLPEGRCSQYTTVLSNNYTDKPNPASQQPYDLGTVITPIL